MIKDQLPAVLATANDIFQPSQTDWASFHITHYLRQQTYIPCASFWLTATYRVSDTEVNQQPSSRQPNMHGVRSLGVSLPTAKYSYSDQHALIWVDITHFATMLAQTRAAKLATWGVSLGFNNLITRHKQQHCALCSSGDECRQARSLGAPTNFPSPSAQTVD